MSDAPSDDRPMSPAALDSWREAYAAGPGDSGGEHPAEERLAALATGELTGEERTRLADHVVVCASCRAAYRTLVDLHRAAGRIEPTPVRAVGRRWLVVGASAAVLAAAVGLAIFGSGAPESDPVVRGPRVGQIDIAPADGAQLDAAPRRFSWTPIAAEEEPSGGTTYRVVLYDAESIPVWRSEATATPAVELPPAVGEALAPGTYYWRIVTDDGWAERISPLARFEIGR
ncbi:MAG: zf-HC2 domain-containing protein [Thermoanaerobaculia bacterium]|nr:zf-HC2 domain-containing protein [Thermoanaerobaculia bacterium]